MSIYREPDFGAEPRKTYLVEDRWGTIYVAYYDGGVWWEGRYDPDRTKVQLPRVPTKMYQDDEGTPP